MLVGMIRSSTPLLLFDDTFDDLLVFRHILDKHLIDSILGTVAVAAPSLSVLFVGDSRSEDAHCELLPSFCKFLQCLLEFGCLSDL